MSFPGKKKRVLTEGRDTIRKVSLTGKVSIPLSKPNSGEEASTEIKRLTLQKEGEKKRSYVGLPLRLWVQRKRFGDTWRKKWKPAVTNQKATSTEKDARQKKKSTLSGQKGIRITEKRFQVQGKDKSQTHNIQDNRGEEKVFLLGWGNLNERRGKTLPFSFRQKKLVKGSFPGKRRGRESERKKKR